MLPTTIKNKIEQIWLDVIAGGVSPIGANLSKQSR